MTLTTLASELDFLGLWSAADRLRAAERSRPGALDSPYCEALGEALEAADREVWGAFLAVGHLAKRRPARGGRVELTRTEVAYREALELAHQRIGHYRFAGHFLAVNMRHLIGYRYSVVRGWLCEVCA